MAQEPLTSPPSGSELSTPPPHRSPSPVDRFNFDWTLKNPAGEPTRPRGIPNPPPVDLQEPRLDLTAKARHEDQDRVFVQASPYIFQRKQGGWNAKLPEVNISDHRTIAGAARRSLQETAGAKAIRGNLLKSEARP